MAITRTDSTGKEVYLTDPAGNEILKNEKAFAAILLSLVCIFAVILIIAHWPDKMPKQGDANVCTTYRYKWFHITYLGKDGVNTDNRTIVIKIKTDSGETSKTIEENDVTVEEENADTNTQEENQAEADTAANTNDSAKKETKQTVSKKDSADCVAKCLKDCNKKNRCTIDLNTLILLLVAFSGFLGNMIHISASFTNYIGAGKFRRSWMLWYFVKPFTAAGLAVGVYIIFRAGFLNSAEATASVNLYGVVAIAILAGLYTDMATQKLKEIFGVVFQSSTVRPNPIELPPLKITSVYPNVLPLNKETEIIISGIGFENRVFKLKVDEDDIPGAVVQPNSIVFKYTATTAKPILYIYDEKGSEITKYELIVTDVPPSPANPDVTVTSVVPDKLKVDTVAEIIITGTALNTEGLVVKINDVLVPAENITATAESIKVNYTPTAKGDIQLSLTDAGGTVIVNKTIAVE